MPEPVLLPMLAQIDAAAPAAARWDLWEAVTTFVNTPAPYSPFSEYLLVLFILWLLARRANRQREDFNQQAQEVLDDKYASGELTQRTYHRFRQQLTLRGKS